MKLGSEAGGWSEEFGTLDAYQKAKESDPSLVQIFEQSRRVWVEATNRGESRFRARSSADSKKKRGFNAYEKMNELRQTRKRLLKKSAREWHA